MQVTAVATKRSLAEDLQPLPLVQGRPAYRVRTGRNIAGTAQPAEGDVPVNFPRRHSDSSSDSIAASATPVEVAACSFG